VSDDEAIISLALAIAEAAKAGRWDVVDDLNRTMQQLKALTGHARQRTVNSEPMHELSDSHRAALSEAIKPGTKFLKWIRSKEHGGYSQNRLAAAVGMKPSTFSQARMAKSDPNSRPISESKAKQVQKLTGWPADDAHWPAGIRKD
jgi:hypothetical protein